MQALVAADKSLAARWNRTLELAAAMADDDAISSGVRYDALRILGADSFESVNDRMSKYLQPGVADDLQMGAISAMADINHAGATIALLNNFSTFTAANRDIAFLGLIRAEQRIDKLLTRLETSNSTAAQLTDGQIEKLKELKCPLYKIRIEKLYPGK